MRPLSRFRRTRPSNRFTQIRNQMLADERLSFKSKGLLSYMLSKPPGWRFSLRHLASTSKDGIAAIRTGMAELEEYGYLWRFQPNVNGSFHEVVYAVSDDPEDIAAAKQRGENELILGGTLKSIPLAENRTPSNTVQTTIKDSRTKVLSSSPSADEEFDEDPFTEDKKIASSSAKKESPSPRARIETKTGGGLAGLREAIKAQRNPVMPSVKKRYRPNKSNPWVDFLRNVKDAWNEKKKASWPSIEKLTPRDMKELAGFWQHFDKDVDEASEAFELAVRWAAAGKESWMEDKVLSLSEIAANDKLITYAQKGRHVSSERQQQGLNGKPGAKGAAKIAEGSTALHQGATKVEIQQITGNRAEVVEVATGEIMNVYLDELTPTQGATPHG